MCGSYMRHTAHSGGKLPNHDMKENELQATAMVCTCMLPKSEQTGSCADAKSDGEFITM